MARRLDLFRFFYADISFYMVFHLTIIRCSILRTPSAIHILGYDIRHNVLSFRDTSNISRAFLFAKINFSHYSNFCIHDKETKIKKICMYMK